MIDDVGEEFEVNFLRKSGWGGFTFPDVPDICDVAKSDVVLRLPTPQSTGGTSRAKRRLTFLLTYLHIHNSYAEQNYSFKLNASLLCKNCLMNISLVRMCFIA